MRIRTAIFIVYLSASALAFAALTTIAWRDVRRRYIESMRRTLGDTAVFLATFAAARAVDADWAQQFAILPAQENLLRVFVLDADGRVQFDTGATRDVGQVYDWPMTGGGANASENYSIGNVAQVGDELRVRAAVRRDGKRVGWVGVGRPLATLKAGISVAQRELLKYAALISVAMICAGWWIATRLTRSLERLTDYAIAVREGRHATPPVSRATEIAALGQAFEQMRVTLEGKAYVERYTQALAHELKAPLSAVRGAAELLCEDMAETDRARFIANLRAESNRMQRLVDRMLDLSALEARRSHAEQTEIAVNELLNEVVEANRLLAEQRGIVLTIGGTDTGAVRGDRLLLLQALGNLVHNALEHTPRDGRVTVSATPRERQVLVVIDDTGPGIPPYALERVFERFYSLPRPDTGRKSSGLGLSIVREIARLHRGDIVVHNRSEGGVRATLTLPAA